MKLWKISQDVNRGYDTYDSAVVVAETENDARLINPEGQWGNPEGEWDIRGAWCDEPEQVRVEYIGQAALNLEPNSVVLASFNAG